jgi:sodium/proline symporter
MDLYVIVAFILYFLILVGIGLYASRKNTTEADFMVGNRSLNFWVIALSAHASDMSAWLFMAFPAAIFLSGLSYTWVAVGLLVGMFLNWHFVAKKLREQTEKYQSYTLSTYFERRFGDKSGVLRLLSAIMCIFFMTWYLSGGLIAMGNLLHSLFGIDYYWGIFLASAVVVIYTFSGGFVAVAWTDMFQAIFLLAAVIIVPIIAFGKIDGGWETIKQIAAQKEIGLSMFSETSWLSVLVSLNLALGWGLGYFGMPHIITKFMGIKDANDMYKSKYLGMAWQTIALAAATMIGVVGIAFFPDGLASSELIFVEMVKELFPAFIVGFLLCGVIAANMSTMDSQILVCSSILTEDLYKHAFKHKASPTQILRFSRLCVIAVSLIALCLAWTKSNTVSSTVLYAWTGLGCAFGPVVLAALYSTSVNRYGAIAGIVTGGLVAAVWPTLNAAITDFHILGMIPGFAASFLAIFVVSKLTNGNEATFPANQQVD